jgi:hypothetical protein
MWLDSSEPVIKNGNFVYAWDIWICNLLVVRLAGIGPQDVIGPCNQTLQA